MFAHTNGFGDFVLLDELGPPWPVHACYANRFLVTSGGALVVRHDRRDEYRDAVISGTPRRPTRLERNITKIDPAEFVGGREILAIGYVQDYVERRVDDWLEKAGTLGRQILQGIFGSNKSQLTLITADQKSYTMFADLRRTVVQRGDIICARITAVRVLGIPTIDAAFLADEIFTMHGGE